jgi:serine/threonine protein kinase
MPWIQGESIETFIYKNLSRPEVLNKLAVDFYTMVQHLHSIGIAHGDLSHQNIMVRQGELVLIDYDGMFVPGMDRLGSVEIGHSHFQHPTRTFGHFDKNLDRFSSIVIYLAISALASHPELWKKYESAGDGLMFRKADFLSPFTSPLLQEMETLSSMRKMVGLFRNICLSDVDQIPTLEQFLSGKVDLHSDIGRLENIARVDKVDFPLDASLKFQMGRKLGQIVTVIGRVTEVFEGKTRDGQAHFFINFGNWRSKCFTIVLWGEAYKSLKERSDLAPDNYLDRWVSVHGILTSYKNRFQIALDEPFGIEMLVDESEAMHRLGKETNHREYSSKPDPTIPSVSSEPIKPVPKTPVKADLEKLRKYSDLVATRIDELYRNKK